MKNKPYIMKSTEEGKFEKEELKARQVEKLGEIHH